MTKKFYVPEKKVIGASSPIPKAVEKAFPKIEESKNSIDPSTFKNSTLERLPQPTGWRILVIPYYMKQQTKGGVFIPDDIRDKESFPPGS